MSGKEMLVGRTGLKSLFLSGTGIYVCPLLPKTEVVHGEWDISHSLLEVNDHFFVCIEPLRTAPLSFQAGAQV